MFGGTNKNTAHISLFVEGISEMGKNMTASSTSTKGGITVDIHKSYNTAEKTFIFTVVGIKGSLVRRKPGTPRKEFYGSRRSKFRIPVSRLDEDAHESVVKQIMREMQRIDGFTVAFARGNITRMVNSIWNVSVLNEIR